MLGPIVGTRDPSYHEFNVCPDRLVNNLEIHWNVDSLCEDEHLIDTIREVMNSHGFPAVGLHVSERDVIRRYGEVPTELDRVLVEIEELRRDLAQLRRRAPARYAERWKRLNAEMEQRCISAIAA